MHAKEVVRENIGWALLSFEKEEAERWLDALPDIGYYGFGRYLPHPAFVLRKGIIFGEREPEYL